MGSSPGNTSFITLTSIRIPGLAVKRASEWERLSKAGQQSSGSSARLRDLERGHLPPAYAAGLRMVDWPGRSQVIEDDLLGVGEGGSPGVVTV